MKKTLFPLRNGIMVLSMMLFTGYLSIQVATAYTNTSAMKILALGSTLNTPPTASNVDFTGAWLVGGTLTGTYDFTDNDNDSESGSTFKWYRSDDNSGTSKTAIAGATSLTYSPTTDDLGKYISFEVTPSDGTTGGTPVESELKGEIIYEPCTVENLEGGFAGGFQSGQSFKASCSGPLRNIGVIVVLHSTGHSFSIYEGDGTTGNVLGTVSSVELHASALHLGNDYRYLDFSSQNINLVEGQTYTFFNSSNDDPNVKPTLNQSGNTNPYADGSLYLYFGGAAATPIPAQDLQFKVNIGPDINDAPVFTKGADDTVNEDLGFRTISSWATNIGDGDATGQALTFTVTNDNNALFETQPDIDEATGNLTYKSALNAHGSATVTVSLADNGGTDHGGTDTSESQTFTITVNPANDEPSFTAGSTLAVNEDGGSQIVTGWATNISAGPADEAGQSVTFNVTNNDNSAFSVQPAISSDGTLTYTPADDANGTITLRISLSDDGGTANGGDDTSSEYLTVITIYDINDAPTFTIGADQIVDEDAGDQVVQDWITDLKAGPPNESLQQFNYNISNDNNALFNIQPHLSFTNDHKVFLDYTPANNAHGTATVTLNFTDNGGTSRGGVDTSEDQTFTITVNSVNDAPVLVDSGDKIFDFENASGIGTPSIKQTVADIEVELLAEGGFFLLGAFGAADGLTGNSPFNLIPAISGDAIVVSFSEPIDLTSFKAAEGNDANQAHTWTFTPVGGEGNNVVTETVDPLTASTVNVNWKGVTGFTVNADNANSGQTIYYMLDDLAFPAPYVRGLSSVGEDQTADIIDGDLVSDFSNNAEEIDTGDPFGMAVTAVDNTNGTWQYSLDAGSNWTEFGSPSETEARLLSGENKIRFLPNTGFSGTVTNGLTYRSWDQTVGTIGQTADASVNGGITAFSSTTLPMEIVISPINDAPSFTKGADQIIDEDAGAQTVSTWATSIDDGDTEVQTLTFNVTNDNNSLFAVQPAINGTTGDLTYTPAANANGSATVTVTLSDDAGTEFGGVDTSGEQTFTITINPVNDAPVMASSGSSLFTFETATGSGTDNVQETVGGVQMNITTSNGAELLVDSYFDHAGTSGKTLTYLSQSGSGAAILTVSFDQAINLTSLRATEYYASVEISWKFTPIGGSGNNSITSVILPTGTDPGATINANWTGITGFTIESLHSSGGNAASFVLDNILLEKAGLSFLAVNEDDINNSGDLVSNYVDGVTDSDPDDVIGMAITTVDNTNGTWQYSTDAGSNWEDFGSPSETETRLLSGENKIRFVPSEDFHGDVSEGFTFKAWDQSSGTIGETADATVGGGITAFSVGSIGMSIKVESVNDAPSFTKGADQTVNEDTGAQTVSAWASNMDDEDVETQALTFNVSNDNNSLFSVQPAIDETTGDLTYTLADNVNGVSIVTVNLSDNGGTDNGGIDTSDDQTFTITVNSINDEPSFTKGADETVLEDAGAQTVSAWATSIDDGDAEVQTLTFAVSNDNNSLFSVQPAIDGSTGNLTYTPADNTYGAATVTVSVSDDGGTDNGGDDTSAEQTFTITVTSVNDAPTFTKGADETVLEDAGAQSVSAWATNLSDSDDGSQSLTFSVTNDNNSLFSVQPDLDETTGNLTFTPTDNANGSATITVNIMDDGGTDNGGIDESSQTFTITVTAVNDEPSFTKGVDESVLEDAGAQTVSAWATGISDNDGDTQTLSFNVTNNNNGLFAVQPAIDGTTGDLTYTPADNANGSATVTVNIMDDGGTDNGGDNTSVDQTFTIIITSVNDKPSFTKGADETVLEDAGAQTISAWATNINDSDDGSQALTFNISNDNNNLFAVQPDVDVTTGNLTFTTAENIYGSASVTISLSDNGGTANGGDDTSENQTFTITVTSVNDIPSFVGGSDQTVNEDAGEQIESWVTSVDMGADNESGQTHTFNVSNDNNDLFSVQPSIDTDGILSYTPSENANGAAIVTVNLKDNGGTDNGGIDTSANVSFTITVNSINDVPSFTKGADQTVLEDAGNQTANGWATNISEGATNESSQILTFNVNNDNNSLFSVQPTIDGSTGDLTYTLSENANGVANITVNLSDDGGTDNGGDDTSEDQTFSITVTAVNDVPSFVGGSDQTVNEDADVQTVSWATGIDMGAANETEQSHNFNVSNNNIDLFSVQPSIDTDGILSYTPAANANGIATVTVSIIDNGGTDNGGVNTSEEQTFTITVNQVNDIPSFTKGTDQEVLEDSGVDVAGRANDEVVVSGWATNINKGADYEDEQVLIFNVSNDNNALFSVQPAVNAVNGDLTYTLAENANGLSTVSVFVSDNGGTANGGQDTSESQSFIITVIPINDAPNFSASQDQIILEDAEVQTVSSWATNITTGAENESDQNLTFNLLSNTNPDLFLVLPNLDPSTGDLTYTAAPNANGKADLIISLSDDGGIENGGENTSVRKFLTIEVTAVNDAPSFTKGDDQVLNEGVGTQTVLGWATGISAGPENEQNQSLSFELSTDNDNLFASLPSIDAVSGDLTYAIASNSFGTATVAIKLKDNGGTASGGIDTSSEETFTITVNSVNDIPEFTSSPSEIAIEDALYNYNVIVSDNDADATLTITISQKPDWLSLTDNGDGTAKLSGTPTNDEVGNHDIVLEVTDGIISESISQVFQIEVMNTNDAPILSSSLPSDIEFCPQPESVEIELSDFVTDIDPGDELTYSVSFNSMDDVEVELDGSLLIIDHSAKESGAFDITVEVKDKASLSVTADITVNVNYFEMQIKNDGNLLRVVSDGDVQWYRDGNAIAGATSGSYRASEVGTYKVRVTKGNCFIESSDIEIDALTNIELSDISESVNVYPNPTNSYLNIEGNQLLSGKTEMIIYDIQGKMVMYKTLTTSRIDISSLQKGVYILQLIKDDKSRAIKKIIKL